MINQIAVMTVNVVAEAPEPGHGDTEASPMPDPTARRINEVAAATTVPAITAGQDTAAMLASRGPAVETCVGAGSVESVSMTAIQRFSDANTEPAAG